MLERAAADTSRATTPAAVFRRRTLRAGAIALVEDFAAPPHQAAPALRLSRALVELPHCDDIGTLAIDTKLKPAAELAKTARKPYPKAYRKARTALLAEEIELRRREARTALLADATPPTRRSWKSPR